MRKSGRSNLVGRELLVAACVTGAVVFLMLWLAGDRSFVGSLVVGAVFGFVVHYIGKSLKGDKYTPPAPVSVSTSSAAESAKPEAAAPPEQPVSEPTTAHAPQAVVDPEVSSDNAAAGVSPTFLSQPGAEGSDDLKKIRGVGPKLEQTLNGMGVFHYAQVAAGQAPKSLGSTTTLKGSRAALRVMIGSHKQRLSPATAAAEVAGSTVATEQDRSTALKARTVAVVIVATMVLWMGAQFLGGKLGLPPKYAFLFDFAALAALVWAMIVTNQIRRARRSSPSDRKH